MPRKWDCLKLLIYRHKKPYLEIGVGSGRFAQALGVEYGVDLSLVLLSKAKSKGIHALKSTGDKLPFANEMFGGILIAFSLCFFDNPTGVLYEARRVLKVEGGLVLEVILRGSPWAEFYAAPKGKKGIPYTARHISFLKKRWKRCCDHPDSEYLITDLPSFSHQGKPVIITNARDNQPVLPR